MPRRRLPPRLYLDKKRGQWAIRDGQNFIRTSCAAGETAQAERILAEYIARKHEPLPSPSPPVADILLAYLRDKIPEAKSRSAKYNISNLAKFWGDKTLAEVTATNCKAYAKTRTQSAARADLEKLATAIRYWHVEYGPLAMIPAVWKPPKPEPRDRWLTRREAARFLWETRRVEHLKRFVLLGLHTGTRSGVLRDLEWSWIDLDRKRMRRRAPRATETRNKRTPTIEIPRQVLHFLRRWKEADAGRTKHVVHYDGQPIRRDLYRAWNTAKTRAGLPWLHPHILRHTATTWRVQRGMPLWDVAGYMGMTVKVWSRSTVTTPQTIRAGWPISEPNLCR
jgi:integrase